MTDLPPEGDIVIIELVRVRGRWGVQLILLDKDSTLLATLTGRTEMTEALARTLLTAVSDAEARNSEEAGNN